MILQKSTYQSTYQTPEKTIRILIKKAEQVDPTWAIEIAAETMMFEELSEKTWEIIIEYTPELALLFPSPKRIRILAAALTKAPILRESARRILREALRENPSLIAPVALSAINNGYIKPEELIKFGGALTSAALIMLAKQLIENPTKKNLKETLEKIRETPADTYTIKEYTKKYGLIGFAIALRKIGATAPRNEIIRNIAEPSEGTISIKEKLTPELLAGILLGETTIQKEAITIKLREEAKPAKVMIRISKALQQRINAILEILTEMPTRGEKMLGREIKPFTKIDITKTIKMLKLLLRDDDNKVRWAAAKAIGEIFRGTGSTEALQQLKPLLRDEVWWVKEAAAKAIGEIFRGSGREIEALQQLKPLLRDEVWWVKEAAKKAIDEMIKSG